MHLSVREEPVWVSAASHMAAAVACGGGDRRHRCCWAGTSDTEPTSRASQQSSERGHV